MSNKTLPYHACCATKCMFYNVKLEKKITKRHRYQSNSKGPKFNHVVHHYSMLIMCRLLDVGAEMWDNDR